MGLGVLEVTAAADACVCATLGKAGSNNIKLNTQIAEQLTRRRAKLYGRTTLFWGLKRFKLWFLATVCL